MVLGLDAIGDCSDNHASAFRGGAAPCNKTAIWRPCRLCVGFAWRAGDHCGNQLRPEQRQRLIVEPDDGDHSRQRLDLWRADVGIWGEAGSVVAVVAASVVLVCVDPEVLAESVEALVGACVVLDSPPSKTTSSDGPVQAANTSVAAARLTKTRQRRRRD